jgi:O-antigen/teichoic acid export membrane protein
MKKSLLGLISIALVGGLVGRALRYLFNVVIARGLGAKALGLFAFGMVVMKALGVIARFGLDSATQKHIPIYRTDKDYARVSGVIVFALLFSFLFGLILAGVGYVYIQVFPFGSELDTAMALFLIGIPLFASMMIGRTATTGFKETQYAVYIRDIIQPVTGILFIAAGAYYFESIELTIAGYVGSLGIGSLAALYFLHRLGAFQASPHFEVKKTLAFSGPVVIVAVAQYIVSWTDLLMLGYFVSPTEVGWYQAAYLTSVLLVIILGAVNSIFPTLASDLYNEGKILELQHMYSAVTKWITYFTILGLAFIAIYASEILLIFNISSGPARTALIVLALGQAVSASTGPVGFLLTMSGYERLESANTVILASLNIVLNFVLIQFYGIIGAATATGISFLLLNVLRLTEVIWIYDIQPYNRGYWKGGVGITISVILMFGVSPFVSGDVLSAVLVGVVALGLFLACVHWLGFSEEDRTLIESIQ